jgi:hypothetical protein
MTALAENLRVAGENRTAGGCLVPQTIEVTQVTIVEGGSVSPTKRVIETEHIVSFATGSENMSVLVLAGGELVNVRETYDQLKKMTGLVNEA